MNKEFQLVDYLSNGVENIVTGALKTTFTNPKESLFLTKYALSSKKADKLRKNAEAKGEHIPPFLIASVTSNCNLHCRGCYARANKACEDKEASNQLSDDEWQNIFMQAKDMGVGFILLAGGEPLLRMDLMKKAGQVPEIMFPIFTNGTMLGEKYVKLFEEKRNLLPVISIEGNEEGTDERRGNGVYKQLIKSMEAMNERGVFYGTSVTVTKQNMEEATSRIFLDKLYDRGCKVVFYIEYVPVDEATKNLAPGENGREWLRSRLIELRNNYANMLFVSFPGDEKSSGGCLAAGRGFFHINSHGGAEPCPFSPYSDTSLRDVSLREALQSPLFKRLQENDILLEEHVGGCVLFERQDIVKKYVVNG